jgi:CheY-like chemotaxis protein
LKNKILIVDDEPDIVFAIEKVLEIKKDRYDVISAKNGTEALKLIENNANPDLILLDIMMPEMNGWIFYDKIKNNESWKKIKIIFLTARKDKLAVDAGVLLGDDYITKPFDNEELINRIEESLNN